MNENNEGINFDFASDTLPKIKEMPKWKKYLIIGSVTAVFAILLIVIIILIANSGGNNTDKDKGKGDEEDDRTILGKIICKYEISNTKEPTKILGDQFKNEGNIGVNIAEKKIKYTKEHKFDEIGEVDISFDIYDVINMDYMFKDISSLKSVIMYSSSELILANI